uniref:Uncharacterized protein n=1 Tax=Picea glauca TaxID=3330 RepID=A0A101LV79_PICGL|nr:hypothetical protein ABT39_MTgene2077 [Picea glauca]QHR87105.1 hypothetical protein Q903MT_gene1114 [Picea sitchensis]
MIPQLIYMIIIYALGVRTYTLTGHFWPGRGGGRMRFWQALLA